ncbi:hypothetical protein OEZ85_006317 [Tetradesmus obliquus]|uniref:Uncharacterized protein n=1 Tax=Tetradesmus obliquus TaxID=3088 RepID=A0ABY8TY81_TETOB|nr:hypothetical protein OEZ85_006317 [Tetradesmus obliquus]
MQHNLAPAKRAARLLAALPASLTHLEFAYAGEQQLQFRDVPAIAGLTALHTLRIRRWDSNADITKAEEAAATGGLDPLLLARMQQLQVLELGWLGRGALPALLQVMPQLSSLRRLDLQCEAVVALPASEAARYSNLLPASKHLSKLVLRGTARMLPDARYGCHLFAGRQLPQLQQLALGWDPEAADDPVEDADDLPPPFLDSEAMQAMAGCCPALHTLLAPGCVTEDAQLAPLLQLTALSALFLAGDEIDDDFAEQQLALLVGLKELRVNLASELTDVGVAHLTALTGLHSLILEDCSISEDMSGILHDEGRLELHYRESTGESVAQQLRPRARRAVLLAALEAEEQAGGMEAPGALQALLGAHCGSCQQLREQLEAAQARADAAEAAAAKTSATLTTVATLLKMVLRQVAAERKAHAQQLPQQPAAAVHVEGQ